MFAEQLGFMKSTWENTCLNTLGITDCLGSVSCDFPSLSADKCSFLVIILLPIPFVCAEALYLFQLTWHFKVPMHKSPVVFNWHIQYSRTSITNPCYLTSRVLFLGDSWHSCTFICNFNEWNQAPETCITRWCNNVTMLHLPGIHTSIALCNNNI